MADVQIPRIPAWQYTLAGGGLAVLAAHALDSTVVWLLLQAAGVLLLQRAAVRHRCSWWLLFTSAAAGLAVAAGWALSGAEPTTTTNGLSLAVQYSLFAAGAYQFGRLRRPGSAAEAGAVVLGLAMLAWSFIVLPYLGDPGYLQVDHGVATLYAVIDLALLVTVLRNLADQRRGPARMLAAGGVLLLAAHLYYAATGAEGTAAFRPGGVSYLLIQFWWVLLAAASVHPDAGRFRAGDARHGRTALIAMYTAAVAAPLLPAFADPSTVVVVPALLTSGLCALLLLRIVMLARLAERRAREARAALDEQRVLQKRLAHRAGHDALTGLANRDLLTEHLGRAVAGDRPYGLILCALDGFKEVNDTYGHGVGDAVLRQVAGRLLLFAPEVELVARIGGDEFVFLLTDHGPASPSASSPFSASSSTTAPPTSTSLGAPVPSSSTTAPPTSTSLGAPFPSSSATASPASSTPFAAPAAPLLSSSATASSMPPTSATPFAAPAAPLLSSSAGSFPLSGSASPTRTQSPDFSSLSSFSGADQLARRIVEAIGASPFVVDERLIPLTARAGIAGGAPGSDTALSDADLALRAAKQAGGGIARFDESLRAEQSERARIAAGLRQALTDGGLFMHYQPVVDTETGRIAGVEALMRWRRGDELIPPAVFIPVAEQTGLIGAIGARALGSACRQAAVWHHEHGLYLTVNVSTHQLRDPGFTSTVLGILADSGLPAAGLVLEITESVLVDAADTSVLGELRAHGIRIAIDDFGTGYSSLAYLHTLPVDILKIDQSFIRRHQDPPRPQDVSLTRAILELARGQQLLAVAEGVETAGQAELLRDLHCPLVQGYHFGRPSAPEAIDVLLRKAAIRAAA